MTKNYKDMTQKELRGLLSEKTSELYDLAEEIKRETEFDILLFFISRSYRRRLYNKFKFCDWAYFRSCLLIG